VRKLTSGGRRAVAIAASAVVLGGVAATLLSTNALADPGPMLIATKTTIVGTPQQEANDSLGAVLSVNVQVQALGGSTGPTGDVIVNAGPSNNCAASLTPTANSTVSTGSCEVHNLSDQTYSVYAQYRGSGNWSASKTDSSDSVTLTNNNKAPAITSGTPAEKASVGEDYQATISASGTPTPTYSLDKNAPSWLSINSTTGAVSGTVPSSLGGNTFTYSVIASNSVGNATAGPYTVAVAAPANATDVVSSLKCSKSVSIAGNGSCTLTVTNDGSSTASNITAEITLPSALTARSCGHSGGGGWGWIISGGSNGGCSIGNSGASWSISSLAAGASKNVKLNFIAGAGGYGWGYGHHHSHNSVTVKGSATTSSQSPSVSKATVKVSPRWGWFW
jgi:hypothetical protein